MTWTFRPEPDTGSIIEPEPALLCLLRRDLEPLALPLAIVLGPMADNGSPLHPLVVHMPARGVEQPGDHAIPVATVVAGELDDVFGQALFIRGAMRNLALG